MVKKRKEKKRKINKTVVTIKLLLGSILLAVAFTIAINGLSWTTIEFFGITVILGLSGMFLLFQGIGVLFEIILKRKTNRNELKIFTFRQLQESVFLKPNTMAISSLLVLMTITCFAYGISVGYLFNSKEAHISYYTFQASEEEVKSVINKLDLNKYIDGFYDMKIGKLYSDNFSADGLIKAMENQEDGNDKEILLNNLHDFLPYLISVDSYNKLL